MCDKWDREENAQASFESYALHLILSFKAFRNKIKHSGQVEVVHIVTSQSDLSSKKALGGRRMLTIIQSGVTEPNLWDNSFLVGCGVCGDAKC